MLYLDLVIEYDLPLCRWKVELPSYIKYGRVSQKPWIGTKTFSSFWRVTLQRIHILRNYIKRLASVERFIPPLPTTY